MARFFLLALGLALVSASSGPAQSEDKEAPKAHDYKEDIDHAVKGAADYKAFTDAYKKYQDFHKYLKSDGSSQDFEKFMSDYEKYMDYQKFMKEGSKRQESASADFKDFLNFEKYWNKTQGGHSQQGTGDKTKLPVNFASDGSSDDMEKKEKGAETSSGMAGNFMPGGSAQSGGAGSMAGNFMPGGSTQSGGAGGMAGNFNQYMDFSKYMGISSQYTNKDWMSQWQKYQQEGQSGASVPASATDCKTEDELNAWHEKQVSTAKEWIPAQFAGQTLDAIEKEYKSNLERIKHPEAASQPNATSMDPATAAMPALEMAAQPSPMSQPSQAEPVPDSAEKCQTKSQLDAWRMKQLTQLKYVPKAYQSYTKGPIDAEYDKQLKRIQAAQASTKPAAPQAAAPQAATPQVAKPSMPSVHVVRDHARSATSVGELVAWRADMGFMVDQLPEKDKADWTEVLDQEMQAGLDRLQVSSQATERTEPTELAGKVTQRSRANEFSRSLLVFLVSFSIPVAGVYVYRGVKQASRQGTDFDAQFMALAGDV